MSNHDLPRALVEARSALTVSAVYFAVIMFREVEIRMLPADDPQCPTMMTDGRRIWVNEGFLHDTLQDVAERAYVLAHEVWHVMARHPQRMAAYAKNGLFGRPFYPGLYNVAADAVINASLDEAKIGHRPKKSPGVSLDGVQPTDLVEDVYKRLLDDVPESLDGLQQKLNGQGEMRDADGTPTPGGKGFDMMPATPGADAPGEAQMRDVIASAKQAAEASSKGRGTLPGGLKAFIDSILDPQVDWRELLRTQIVGKAGSETTTWRRPNRRRVVLPGTYLPARTGLSTGPVVIAFDTSASVSDHEIAAILAEASAILTDCRPQSCHVVWCDTQVNRVDEVDEAAELQDLVRTDGVPGRGGTAFNPVFGWVAENLDAPPAYLIYGTDMMAPFPEDPGYPVIWCATTDHEAPWGTTVRVKV